MKEREGHPRETVHALSGHGATKPDVGLEAVERLYKQMQIDQPWSTREERGFTWWGYRLAQHVTAEEPVSEGQRICSTVRISTDVVRDVRGSGDAAAALTIPNGEQTLNALVWDAEHRTINECCTAVVYDENINWLGDVIATSAILQNSAANARAQAVAEMVGGVPATSGHPSSGERPTMDDILNVPAAVIAPQGANPSAFAGDLISRLGPFIQQLNLLGFADDTGFTCEVPYTGSRPAAEVMQSNEPIETSLVRIFTDQPHPQLGAGALVHMKVPAKFTTRAEVAATANRLNLLEARTQTDTMLLGAWSIDPTHDEPALAFNCFVPNLLARPGLLENLIIYQTVRSRFAAGQL